MSSLLEEISQKAQALTADERTQLAHALLASVEDEVDPDIQAAWEAEITQRIESRERGDAHSYQRGVCRCTASDTVKPARFIKDAQTALLELTG